MVGRKDGLWIMFPAGAAGFMVLSLLVPSIGVLGWIIGALAGAGIGYFGYRVRETIRATKQAWAKTKAAIVRERSFDEFKRLFAWVIRSSYIFCWLLAIVWPMLVCLIVSIVMVACGVKEGPITSWIVPGALAGFVVGMMAMFRTYERFEVSMAQMLMRYKWARGWWTEMAEAASGDADRGVIESLMRSNSNHMAQLIEKLGRRFKEDDFRFSLKKFWLAFFVVNINHVIAFVARLAWLVYMAMAMLLVYGFKLVKILHCRERTICGVYSAVGALVMWALVGHLYPQLAPMWKLISIAGAGTLSWLGGRYIGIPVVARRVLKVEPVAG